MKRIAIVTGAVGGIGSEICRQLIKDGFRVVATYRLENENKAKTWQNNLIQEGLNIDVMPVDVSDFTSCSDLVNRIVSDIGPVAVLINNAGITDDATMKNITSEQWHNVLRTNLDSIFNMTKPVFQTMCDNGWGRIINISSINGQKGQFGQVNYSAAKAGIYGFTKSLALEGARKGVTVNSISPGYIGTKMVNEMPQAIIDSIVKEIPIGRLGKPIEIANAVKYLVDEHSGFITGSDLSINGGQHM
ncbi:MAG: acetoacetyl-CoA reductase [Colwellia sp.]